MLQGICLFKGENFMKNLGKNLEILLIFVSFLSVFSVLESRNGGDAALGGFAGSMVGSVVGTAITQGGRDSRAQRDARARQEAREAQKETELLRREHQRERMDRLEQEALKQSIADKNNEIRLLAERLKAIEGVKNNSGQNNLLVGFLIGLSLILFLFIIMLGIFLLRKK